MNVHVIGRPGSDYRKKVDEWLGNVSLERAQCVFNYGLQGERLHNYLERYPRIKDLPNLNLYQFGNKFESVMAVREAGMPAPMSWKYRQREEITTTALVKKPYYSIGGRGVDAVSSANDLSEEERRTHYLQEQIDNRRYELRCICASWIDPKDWRFLKRIHPDGDAVIAWNHHNGGKFQTVNDPIDPLFNRVREDVKKMLPLFEYQFGAVDFIIQNNPGGQLKHFFIEWNLAPGWAIPATDEWMLNCFTQLKKESLENIECYEHGMLLEDVAAGMDNPHGRGGGHRNNVRGNIPAPDFRELEQEPYDPMENEPEHATAAEAAEFLGLVLVHNAANVDRIFSNMEYTGKYRSFHCALGHELLVRTGNYTAYCPVCGDILIIN